MIYELHLGTFTPEGTLDAAIGKLDYLVDLGVDFVELLPVNGFNGTHNWGYDGVLWYAVQEELRRPGGLPAVRRRLPPAGLGVIQDVVYNHLGPSGNYLPRFGPYLNAGGGATPGATRSTSTAPTPTRCAATSSTTPLMWLRDYHVDGLRLDAVHALVKDERAIHLLEEMARSWTKLSARDRPAATLIAESDLNDPRLHHPADARRLRPDRAVERRLPPRAARRRSPARPTATTPTSSPLGALAKVLDRRLLPRRQPGPASAAGTTAGRSTPARSTRRRWWSAARTTTRSATAPSATGSPRPSAPGSWRSPPSLTLTCPFTPMLFMGEEWGATTPWQFFTSHPEPELGKATAEGRIGEFAGMGWDPDVVPDPQDPETFTRSKLDWSEAAEGDHARLLELYRAADRAAALDAGACRPGLRGHRGGLQRVRRLAPAAPRQRGGRDELLRRTDPARRCRQHDRAGHRRRRAPRRRPARTSPATVPPSSRNRTG